MSQFVSNPSNANNNNIKENKRLSSLILFKRSITGSLLAILPINNFFIFFILYNFFLFFILYYFVFLFSLFLFCIFLFQDLFLFLIIFLFINFFLLHLFFFLFDYFYPFLLYFFFPHNWHSLWHCQ